jgi:hypothetical protein
MQHQNSVFLIDYMGSDELIALNAWASTFLELGIELPQDVRSRTTALTDAIQEKAARKRSIPDLLNYLAKEGHISPFRGAKFIFGMKVDIATHIQLMTHTVAIEHTNTESARYKELQDKYYLPADWLEYGEVGADLYRELEEMTWANNNFYHRAIHALVSAGMPKARAKETARYAKMYNSQVNSVRSLNFEGLVTLYRKRGFDSPSQREIAGVVEAMVQAVRDIPGQPFKHSLEAFGMGYAYPVT